MTSSGNPGSGDGYLLSQDILDRCRERAPGYDAENRIFFEDFEELKEAGYTKINLPKEFGGHGKSLAEVATASGYSTRWIQKLIHRDNAGGAAALGDRRHSNAGARASVERGPACRVGGGA